MAEFTGENIKVATWIGQDATGFNLGKLEEFKFKSKSPRTEEQLWKETGTMQYRDDSGQYIPGAYVQEIDDSKLSFKKIKLPDSELLGVKTQGFTYEYSVEDFLKLGDNKIGSFDTTLGEFINHPELFKNYPKLKNLKVNITDSLFQNTYGYYSQASDTLNINFNPHRSHPEQLDELKRTILHEVQHKIDLGIVPKGKKYFTDNRSRILDEFTARDVETRLYLDAERRKEVAPFSKSNEFGSQLALIKNRKQFIEKGYQNYADDDIRDLMTEWYNKGVQDIYYNTSEGQDRYYFIEEKAIEADRKFRNSIENYDTKPGKERAKLIYDELYKQGLVNLPWDPEKHIAEFQRGPYNANKNKQQMMPLNKESDFLDTLKDLENSKKEGWDGEYWKPHTSVEGGRKTIAWGHKLTPEESKGNYILLNGEKISLDKGLTSEQADQLLQQDWFIAQEGAMKFINQKGDFDKLTKKQQLAAIELFFNMGASKASAYTSFRDKVIANDSTWIDEIDRGYTDKEGKYHKLTNRTNTIKKVLL